MSASLKPKAASKTVQRHIVAADRKRLAAAARAVAEEAKAEHLAPKIQREPVLGRNGEVIRGRLVERDGISFRRSNPIRHMVNRSKNKDFPLLTKRHADAADRLVTAFEEGAGGISVGTSHYCERSSSTPQTGVIAVKVLEGVHRQIAARAEIEAVQTYLGASWGAAYSIAIRGIDISYWAEAVGMRPEAAAGFIACVLDRLCEFYSGPERRGHIRAVAIKGRAP